MEINEITKNILNCAYKIHTALGPGLLESAYEECLCYELQKHGLNIQRQKSLPVIYEEVKLEIGYRIDLLVEERIIVELKTVESFTDVHIAQTLTYIKLSSCKVGLLLNFHVSSMKNGIKRLVL
jgi:GxxExxY protein